jgi:hypothetical protein
MRGRVRGSQERIIELAHQTEMMARQKTLKGLQHYLPKPTVTKARGDAGAAKVLAMLRAAKAKQDKAKKVSPGAET